MLEPNRWSPKQWRLCVILVKIILISAIAPALAQQPATVRLLPEDAERGLNGAQHNFDFLAPGVSGNQYQTAGFFGQKLRPYLAGHDEALAYLDQYRRQKTVFLIDRILAVGAFGLYGQQIFSGDTPQYFNNTQKVAIGVFAASVLATIAINRNTNSYLQHAVRSFNEGLTQGPFWPRLRPSTIGLAALPTGQPLLALGWRLR